MQKYSQVYKLLGCPKKIGLALFLAFLLWSELQKSGGENVRIREISIITI